MHAFFDINGSIVHWKSSEGPKFGWYQKMITINGTDHPAQCPIPFSFQLPDVQAIGFSGQNSLAKKCQKTADCDKAQFCGRARNPSYCSFNNDCLDRSDFGNPLRFCFPDPKFRDPDFKVVKLPTSIDLISCQSHQNCPNGTFCETSGLCASARLCDARFDESPIAVLDTRGWCRARRRSQCRCVESSSIQFCCFARLDVSTSTGARVPEQPDDTPWIILMICGVILILVGIVGFGLNALLQMRKKKQRDDVENDLDLKNMLLAQKRRAFRDRMTSYDAEERRWHALEQSAIDRRRYDDDKIRKLKDEMEGFGKRQADLQAAVQDLQKRKEAMLVEERDLIRKRQAVGMRTHSADLIPEMMYYSTEDADE